MVLRACAVPQHRGGPRGVQGDRDAVVCDFAIRRGRPWIRFSTWEAGLWPVGSGT